MNLWWCSVLYFIGYSLWTLHFPWLWTLYLSIFYYQCKPNYHSIFMLKVIDGFGCLLVKMLMFTVFSYHINPETDDCSGLLIKVYYSALMLLLSNNINASFAARGTFLTCYNTMRPISLQLLFYILLRPSILRHKEQSQSLLHSYFSIVLKMCCSPAHCYKSN